MQPSRPPAGETAPLGRKTESIKAINQLWDAFDPIRSIRDPLTAALHPFDFGQTEDLRSRLESVRFVRGMPRTVRRFLSAYVMRDWAVEQSPRDGLFLEFGVASGQSANQFALRMQELRIASRLYGFDTFSGLPEDWRAGRAQGEYAQNRVPAVRENVTLVVGLFQETLAEFLSTHSGVASFVHVDCDLYSSSKYVISTLLEARRLGPGSVILFDELFNYPAWFAGGEYQALRETLPTEQLAYRYIAIAPFRNQAAIRLVARRSSDSPTTE